MIKIIVENATSKLMGLDEKNSIGLWNLLSYEPDNIHQLLKANPKLVGKDLRKRLFQKKRGNFPTGLLYEVEKFLKKKELKYEIDDTRKKIEQYNFYRIRNPFFDMYPHQYKALEVIKNNLVSAISIATGGGKSLVAMKAVQHWGVNTLIIVPGLNLLEQFKEDLEYHFGKDMVGTHLDTKIKPITVANIQGIQKMGEDFFKKFDALIFDESHHVASVSYYDLNKKFWSHIPYRLFLSATLYRNDGTDLKLRGLTGKTLYTYTAREAITDGFIVRPKFYIYKIRHYQGHSMGWHADYDAYIANNKFRDQKIVRIVEKILNNSDKNILILCNRIEHCNNLIKEIEKVTKEKIVLITGQTKNNDKAFRDYRMGKIRCAVATSQVVGEGIDIPNIDLLVIAGGYTSPILINQSVGRVVRLNKEKNKKFGIVIDFFDEGAIIMEKHSEERLKIYKKNFFKEDIKMFAA